MNIISLKKSMLWGILGAIVALIVCWALMFTAKSFQPILIFPMERSLTWLDSQFGLTLIPHEDIPAAFLWMSVYFLILGFVPASVAGFLLKKHRL